MVGSILDHPPPSSENSNSSGMTLVTGLYCRPSISEICGDIRRIAIVESHQMHFTSALRILPFCNADRFAIKPTVCIVGLYRPTTYEAVEIWMICNGATAVEKKCSHAYRPTIPDDDCYPDRVSTATQLAAPLR